MHAKLAWVVFCSSEETRKKLRRIPCLILLSVYMLYQKRTRRPQKSLRGSGGARQILSSSSSSEVGSGSQVWWTFFPSPGHEGRGGKRGMPPFFALSYLGWNFFTSELKRHLSLGIALRETPYSGSRVVFDFWECFFYFRHCWASVTDYFRWTTVQCSKAQNCTPTSCIPITGVLLAFGLKNCRNYCNSNPLILVSGKRWHEEVRKKKKIPTTTMNRLIFHPREIYARP